MKRTPIFLSTLFSMLMMTSSLFAMGVTPSKPVAEEAGPPDESYVFPMDTFPERMEPFYSREGTETFDVRDVTFYAHGELLTNWGSRVEWLNDHQFVFSSGHVADVYLMDVKSNEIVPLTYHFDHAGFGRARPLANGDLLLVGPETGPAPERDPVKLIVNNDQTGRFKGTMSILKAPYTGEPIPLGVPAWEGLAVSHHGNRVVWSDTRVSYYANNIIETGLNYLFKRSNLWTGEIKYDRNGIPYMANKRIIVKKCDIGAVFLEPQDFMGLDDSKLIFTAYGILEGSGDVFVYDFEKESIERIELLQKSYNEWEGVSHDSKSAFLEIDESATLLTGPGNQIDLYIYNFETNDAVPVFKKNSDSDQSVFWHEASFSPDGEHILINFGDTLRGGDMNTMEMHDGFMLFDKEGLIEAAQQRNGLVTLERSDP